jgi:ketosteroid isomerase-like protein
MNYETAREIAKNWCDAWTRKDLDSIMEHYAEDVKFSSPTVIKRLGIAEGWIYGKLKLREHFSEGLKMPNLKFDFVDVLLGVGGMCIFYRRETGVLVSDVVELDEDDKGKVVRAFYSKPR